MVMPTPTGNHLDEARAAPWQGSVHKHIAANRSVGHRRAGCRDEHAGGTMGDEDQRLALGDTTDCGGDTVCEVGPVWRSRFRDVQRGCDDYVTPVHELPRGRLPGERSHEGAVNKHPRCHHVLKSVR